MGRTTPPIDAVTGAWRREPFRVFFPLGIALAWLGTGHWIAYWAGWIASYSCAAHALVQVQGFLLAFALGFLLTALPRRTASEPASGLGIAAAATALVVAACAAFAERWWVAEASTIAVVVGLVGFAVRRVATGTRRPPAAFVLLPLGLACMVAGAAALAWGSGPGDPATGVLGRLLVTQGTFLCLVMGAGALVLPLMSGGTPPADVGVPGTTRAAIGYLASGLVVVATLVGEAAGSARVAPLLRGLVVAATLARGAGLAGPVGPEGTNRRVARLAAWLVPAGPLLAGVLPDYRVPALHLTFIGGFGLLALSVGTHVTASHCGGLTAIRDGRSSFVRVVAAGVLIAALGRLTADATATYFEHLAAVAFVWITTTALWTGRLAPAWLGRS